MGVPWLSKQETDQMDVFHIWRVTPQLVMVRGCSRAASLRDATDPTTLAADVVDDARATGEVRRNGNR